MADMERRSFMKRSLAAGAAFAVSTSASKVLGANDTVRIAVSGIHGRGGSHIKEFQSMDNVEVVGLVDPDSRLFEGRIKQVTDLGGKTPQTYQDIRKALENKDIDAISIATTNHWHALQTIWGCQAGKDVYVEKPMCHEVHEGRIAVDAARKYKRIVQHGTQSRSSSKWHRLAEHAKRGTFGKLLISRGLVYKRRESIGFAENEAPPPELAFDLWLGPAQEQPYNTNLVHYNWHWFWDFGNGDIGNQGVHQMDIARWTIPNGVYPKSAISIGGRFGYYDQGQTANTQIAALDYGGVWLIFEVRGLETDRYLGSGTGDIAHFEEGIVVNADKFYPKGDMDKGEDLPKIDVDMGPGDGHFGNFIAAVRSRNPSDLNADVEEGFRSCIPIHLANISYRLGENVIFENKPKPISAPADAQDTFERMIDHLKANDLNPEWMCYRMGRALKFNGDSLSIEGDAEANKMLTRNYRKPYVVPDKLT
ncbi:MAG: twin-arginine translocation signal domain-containing protein [bacterium]|nr:twin-arginine translocation signal domain-containing protein [bacterium]